MSQSRLSINTFVAALAERIEMELLKTRREKKDGKYIEVRVFANEHERVKLKKMLAEVQQAAATLETDAPNYEMLYQQRVHTIVTTRLLEVYTFDRTRYWGMTTYGATFQLYQNIIENVLGVLSGNNLAQPEDNFFLPPDYVATNDGSKFFRAFLGQVNSKELVEKSFHEALLHFHQASKAYLESLQDPAMAKNFDTELEKYVSSMKIIARMHAESISHWNTLVSKAFPGNSCLLINGKIKEAATRKRAKKLIESPVSTEDKEFLVKLTSVVERLQKPGDGFDSDTSDTPEVKAEIIVHSATPSSSPLSTGETNQPLSVHNTPSSSSTRRRVYNSIVPGTPPIAHRMLGTPPSANKPLYVHTRSASGTSPDSQARRVMLDEQMPPQQSPPRTPEAQAPKLAKVVESEHSRDTAGSPSFADENLSASPLSNGSPLGAEGADAQEKYVISPYLEDKGDTGITYSSPIGTMTVPFAPRLSPQSSAPNSSTATGTSYQLIEIKNNPSEDKFCGVDNSARVTPDAPPFAPAMSPALAPRPQIAAATTHSRSLPRAMKIDFKAEESCTADNSPLLTPTAPDAPPLAPALAAFEAQSSIIPSTTVAPVKPPTALANYPTSPLGSLSLAEELAKRPKLRAVPAQAHSAAQAAVSPQGKQNNSLAEHSNANGGEVTTPKALSSPAAAVPFGHEILARARTLRTVKPGLSSAAANAPEQSKLAAEAATPTPKAAPTPVASKMFSWSNPANVAPATSMSEEPGSSATGITPVPTVAAIATVATVNAALPAPENKSEVRGKHPVFASWSNGLQQPATKYNASGGVEAKPGGDAVLTSSQSNAASQSAAASPLSQTGMFGARTTPLRAAPSPKGAWKQPEKDGVSELAAKLKKQYEKSQARI